jgi:hypothetical protein
LAPGEEVEVDAVVDEVDVGVTIQEHADDTRAGDPSQLDAKAGMEVDDAVVYVGQNWDAAEGCWMSCLRQLS